MDVLHGGAGVLHRVERLLVDVCRLDGVYLALESHDLRLCLLERVLELLLPPEGRLCRCLRVSPVHVSGVLARGSPVLFVLTCFLARASCSSIWFCRCFSRLFSISSCPRSWRIAFFGASFVFCEPPPNQPKPQPDMMGDVRAQTLEIDVIWWWRRENGSRWLRGAAFYAGGGVR